MNEIFETSTKYLRRCFDMSKRGKGNKKLGNADSPKKTGYGDKKLEGPNRPAE
jgi:hypothetical protein